jgi:hypothetical protein
MNRVHSLRFEALEARRLLTGSLAVAAHAAPAAVAAPLVLQGTLTVNHHAATSTMNLDGSSTISAPVSGPLAGLGKVRGVWYESRDSFGNYQGPDLIRLRNAQGTFNVAFSNQTPGPAHPTGHHTVYYQHNQRVQGGTGAYAGARESGSINVNMNASHSAVESLTLNTAGA